ncbi:MAG: hypothetical protein K8E24_013265 [Methanobacterium paludis]|nr:hypothetical protein [Methanobacterium paludis]
MNKEGLGRFQNINNNSNDDLLDNIETKLLEKDFVKQIIIFKPTLGLKIIIEEELDSSFRIQFSNLFFSILVLERGSTLYREIANTEKDRFDKKYVIPEKNKILNTILSPVIENGKKTLIADQYAIYASIGKIVTKILEDQKRKEIDIYNIYNEKFFSRGRFNLEPFDDPIFLGIKFFDILITEALFHKIKWNMGLENYYHFVKQICRNYNDKDFDPIPGQYLNIYSYFLHEIIDNFKRWIEFIIDYTNEVAQPLRNENCTHENDNIIKNSIIYLVFCNEEINDKVNKVPEDDKKSITNGVLDLYFELILSNKAEPKKYGNVLKDCLLNGSSSYKRSLISFLRNYHDPSKLYGYKETHALEVLMSKLKGSLREDDDEYN